MVRGTVVSVRSPHPEAAAGAHVGERGTVVSVQSPHPEAATGAGGAVGEGARTVCGFQTPAAGGLATGGEAETVAGAGADTGAGAGEGAPATFVVVLLDVYVTSSLWTSRGGWKGGRAAVRLFEHLRYSSIVRLVLLTTITGKGDQHSTVIAVVIVMSVWQHGCSGNFALSWEYQLWILILHQQEQTQQQQRQQQHHVSCTCLT